MRIVAPLRVEVVAVGGTRIGMRARRIPPDDRLLLAGVAGAVDPRLKPGDLVVADRILLPPPTHSLDPAFGPGGSAAGPGSAGPGGSAGSAGAAGLTAAAPGSVGSAASAGSAGSGAATGAAAGGGEVLLPGAEELGRVLRIAGMTVFVGAVGGADKIVSGDDRAVWAERGALAVDLESGVLARTGRLAAVVRAVVDTPTHPLVSLGTLPRGTRALRALRRVAPVLSAWADGQGVPDVRERQAAPVDITITLPGEVENS